MVDVSRFTLPRIRANSPITDKDGKAVNAFVLFWEKLCRQIEGQENSQNNTLALVQQIQAQQAAQLALINQALELAGLALETADGGSTTKSGSSSDLFNLISTSFVPGALVSLTSVLAGTLEVPGTGPQAIIGTTTMTGGTVTNGEYQLVEVVGGVDTVLFTGSFVVTDITGDEPSQIFQINLLTSPGIYTRATTGAVDYRIDTRRTSGANMTGLRFYLFARRAV